MKWYKFANNKMEKWRFFFFFLFFLLKLNHKVYCFVLKPKCWYISYIIAIFLKEKYKTILLTTIPLYLL